MSEKSVSTKQDTENIEQPSTAQTVVEDCEIPKAKPQSDENIDSQSKDSNAGSDYSNISFDETTKPGAEENKVIEDGGIVPLENNEVPPLAVHVSSLKSNHQNAPSSLEVDEDQKNLDPKKLEKLSKSEKELKDLCRNMFGKLENYLKGEVANSVEDYSLLERMNRSTSYKYQEMLKVATTVGQSMHEINNKFSDLRPYLEQIEEIEKNVVVLEKAAYKLDGYAKRLEERFRKLEKR